MGLFGKKRKEEETWDAEYADRVKWVREQRELHSASNLLKLSMDPTVRKGKRDYSSDRVAWFEALIREELYECACAGNTHKLITVSYDRKGYYFDREYFFSKEYSWKYGDRLSLSEWPHFLTSLSIWLEGVKIEKHYSGDRIVIIFNWL